MENTCYFVNGGQRYILRIIYFVLFSIAHQISFVPIKNGNKCFHNVGKCIIYYDVICSVL